MNELITIIITAFVLQLSALPGEKGQLIIAGLSSNYHPVPVVLGASTAFGGWTIIEILVGNKISSVLPVAYLDGAMAVLLLAFAGWVLHSEPLKETTDKPPEDFSSKSGFLASFTALSIGEVGDKTQLVTFALAARFGASPGIWVGEMLAIIPVSFLTAYGFHFIAEKISSKQVHWISASIFILFAADITLSYIANIDLIPFF